MSSSTHRLASGVATALTACAIGFAATSCGTAHATIAAGSCHVIDGRADAQCTPGALNPAVTQATIHSTICVAGWTATVRPPTSYTTALKRRQMVEYGMNAPLATVEEDHLIPLSSGGSPTDPRNLWPEAWEGQHGAHAKDTDEVRTQHDICAGRITLAEGQQRILATWTH